MKTVTITLPEALDREAVDEARRRGMSKSELIRLGLGEVLPAELATTGGDLWTDLAGFARADVSTEAGEIDRTLYGP